MSKKKVEIMYMYNVMSKYNVENRVNFFKTKTTCACECFYKMPCLALVCDCKLICIDTNMPCHNFPKPSLL